MSFQPPPLLLGLAQICVHGDLDNGCIWPAIGENEPLKSRRLRQLKRMQRPKVHTLSKRALGLVQLGQACSEFSTTFTQHNIWLAWRGCSIRINWHVALVGSAGPHPALDEIGVEVVQNAFMCIAANQPPQVAWPRLHVAKGASAVGSCINVAGRRQAVGSHTRMLRDAGALRLNVEHVDRAESLACFDLLLRELKVIG